MSSRFFAYGVEDKRAGRGFRSTYDTWKDSNSRWEYERGRAWATLAPPKMALKKRDGTLNPAALNHCASAMWMDDVL